MASTHTNSVMRPNSASRLLPISIDNRLLAAGILFLAVLIAEAVIIIGAVSTIRGVDEFYATTT
jgi:hypothetical protein